MNDIAVVISCRNLGRFLLEALDSVAAQTRPASEIVVVDDGSDDAYTIGALADVRRRGIWVVQTTHAGVAAARNTGVRSTSAPYVVLLDADDRIEADYLKRLGGVLDADPAVDFVTCGLRAFGQADYVWTPPPCSVPTVLTRGGPHISSMFHRKVWVDTGGFDSAPDGYEDTDFWLSALLKGFHGVVIDEPLLQYRVRGGSRYARVLEPRTFMRTYEYLYAKHWPVLDASQRLAAVREQDQFIHEQKAHANTLQRATTELEERLTTLAAEVKATAAALERVGSPSLDWGDWQSRPVSTFWGLDRGGAVDRYYIERFLESNCADIAGRVLEVKDAGYTHRFGSIRVTRSDIVDIDRDNPQATICGDLSDSTTLPAAAFDCVILTQTLHLVFDLRAVVRTAHRALKPGGVLLCTIPAISKVDTDRASSGSDDFWRLTPAAVRSLFAEVFPDDALAIVGEGNLPVCAAFLQGLGIDDLAGDTLSTADPFFPLITCVRAVKPREDRATSLVSHMNSGTSRESRVVVLVYHRIASPSIDTHSLAIGTDAFRDQMQHLKRNFEVMSLSELLDRLGAAQLPRRAVAVTLDDGYVDGLTTAAPILEDTGVPATFFVTSDLLDRAHEYWWDVLEELLSSTAGLPSEFEMDPAGRIVPCQTDADRARLHQELIGRMYAANLDERSALLDRVVAWSGRRPCPRDTHRRLTGREIQALSGRPLVSIGAHSVHHLSLAHQAAPVQWHEVQECKRQLEALLGRPVEHFAYPYGDFTSDTMHVVRDAGFRSAVTVGRRTVRTGAVPFLVPRCEVPVRIGQEFGAWLTAQFEN